MFKTTIYVNIIIGDDNVKKILIKVHDKKLSFSIYKDKQKVENLNNTNVIDTDQMIFSDTYIEKNLDLLRSFIKLVVIKNNVDKLVVDTNDIAPLAIRIIRDIESVNKVFLNENKTINLAIFEAIYESKYITSVDCYSIPSYMFDKLDISKDIKVKSRCEILFLSNFMEDNNFTNYSDVYYKKSIDIRSELSNEDKEDLISFFKINNSLKLINLYYYDDEVMIELMHLIKDNNKRNIKIVIHQKKKDDIIHLIDKTERVYKNIIKDNNIVIKPKYSKEYRDKNVMKQVNLTLFRLIVIGIIIISIVAIVVFKIKDYHDNKDVNEINRSLISIKKELVKLDKIEDTTAIDNSEKDKHENGYDSPYYRTFTKVLSELQQINDETVGWLKVKNTKVDYPVVQHSDNDYYLNHSFYKEQNLHGWVFMDYRNNRHELDTNTILYAHRNTSGLMFGTLKNTLEESWYSNPDNLVITFNTLDGEHRWKIFSIYTIGTTKDYLSNAFVNDKSYQKFLNTITKRSLIKFSDKATTSDKILTLSTCYNNADYRLVVHAKMIS